MALQTFFERKKQEFCPQFMEEDNWSDTIRVDGRVFYEKGAGKETRMLLKKQRCLLFSRAMVVARMVTQRAKPEL